LAPLRTPVEAAEFLRAVDFVAAPPRRAPALVAALPPRAPARACDDAARLPLRVTPDFDEELRVRVAFIDGLLVDAIGAQAYANSMPSWARARPGGSPHPETLPNAIGNRVHADDSAA
jgi:hypothetical protein